MMISQILEYTKKYYPCTLESGTYTIETDGISGTFSADYLVGQYINIYGSVINDGVYKITGVTPSKLTLNDTLFEETNTICLYGLALPKGYLSLISDIESYTTNKTNQPNVTSETQGKRSVTYKDGSSWKDAFGSRLSAYMSVYDDRKSFSKHYNIYTKGY